MPLPDNYKGMKPPRAHADPRARRGEIKRIIARGAGDKMPLDDNGLYNELDPSPAAALLKYGASFESLVDAARNWEASNP